MSAKRQSPVRKNSASTPPSMPAKPSSGPRRNVTVAVDPGLAQVGIAAVQWMGTTPSVLRAELVRTKKAKKKELQQIRVATDDLRRMREIWVTLEVALDDLQPMAVALEGYSPMDPATQQDPFPYYAALRDKAPVHQGPGGIWFVSRHAAVMAPCIDSRR